MHANIPHAKIQYRVIRKKSNTGFLCFLGKKHGLNKVKFTLHGRILQEKLSFCGITHQATLLSLVHTWTWSEAPSPRPSNLPKVCEDDVVYGNRHTFLLVLVIDFARYDRSYDSLFSSRTETLSHSNNENLLP
jgi:hypothetical protein